LEIAIAIAGVIEKTQINEDFRADIVSGADVVHPI
jgi:hypothetical protein